MNHENTNTPNYLILGFRFEDGNRTTGQPIYFGIDQQTGEEVLSNYRSTSDLYGDAERQGYRVLGPTRTSRR